MEGELVAKKLYDEESMTQLLSTTANVLGESRERERGGEGGEGEGERVTI